MSNEQLYVIPLSLMRAPPNPAKVVSPAELRPTNAAFHSNLNSNHRTFVKLQHADGSSEPTLASLAWPSWVKISALFPCLIDIR